MTAIEWTDEVWNPVTGCTKVSSGCKNCYAERHAGRKLPHGGFTDRPFTEVRLHPDRLDWPLRWRGAKQAKAEGRPSRIFVNSMSDLFHDDVPDEFIIDVYAVMVAAWWQVFQILTKRPERRRQLWSTSEFHLAVARKAAKFVNKLSGSVKDQSGRAVSASLVGTMNMAKWQAGAATNIWEGVSVEDQRTADERIPLLLQTSAAVRFVSYEPALGPVDFRNYGHIGIWRNSCVCGAAIADSIFEPQRVPCDKCGRSILTKFEKRLDWIICGGESGPGARPCDIAWLRSVVKQGKAAGVPVFVKQLGRVVRFAHGAPTFFFKHPKGGDPSEWPEDLRVREFPR